MLTDEASRTEGTGKWLEKYGRVYTEDKMPLLLGKGMEVVSYIVMEGVGECTL